MLVRQLISSLKKFFRNLFRRFFYNPSLKMVFDHITEGVLVTDTDKKILLINPAFSKITGYSANEVLGKTPKILSSGKHDADFYQKMWASIHENGRWQGEIWNKKKRRNFY